MNRRNTKQKEVILDVILKSTNHPTIKEIYQQVQKIDSSIGQATVYRNINSLAKEGTVKKLSDTTNEYHYDGNVKEHNHFICKNCHKIIDIFTTKNKNNIKSIAREYSLLIDEVSITYEGLCNNCK